MKRRKFTPIEGFLENPGVEKVLNLLMSDNVIAFILAEHLSGYSMTLNAPIPKTTPLRIYSTEEAILIKEIGNHRQSIFNAFSSQETAQYINYTGFNEGDTLMLFENGEILFPHACRVLENGEYRNGFGSFPLWEGPYREIDDIKFSFEAYDGGAYNFIDFLQDIIDAKDFFNGDPAVKVILPATISPATKEAIENFLKPYFEEVQEEIKIKKEKRKLDLQQFNNIPSTLTPLFIGDKTYIATSKVANSQSEIYEETLEGQFALVDVGERNKEHVDVKTSIICEAGAPEPLDKYLQDSIGTMMQNSGAEAGATFSLDQITREFYGLQAGAKVTKKTRAEIEASIDKQRSAKVTIDFEEQAIKHNHTGVRAKLEGNLLDAHKLTVNVGGSEIVGYRFLTLPIYYKYSADTKQMSDVDRKMLSSKITDPESKDPDNKERARYTNLEFALIKRFMLQSIGVMQEKKKKGQSWTSKCSYDTIIKEIGPDKPTEKQIRTIKKGINEYAEILKTNGYITDFKPYKNRGSRGFNGIEIIL